MDGKPFDGGKAEGYTLTLGSGAFIPGFEDQLVGLKAGDEKDVVVTFPENYTKELAGKEATFKCKIHEVKGDHQARTRRRVCQGCLRIRHAGRAQEEHQGRPRRKASGSC